MAAFSDFLETALLNHTLRNIAYAPAAAVYVGLFTSATSDGTTTGGAGQGEVSNVGTAYARQAVTFGVPASGQTSNTADIIFPTATSGWGTVTHCAIFDNATYGAGNCLYHGPLATPKTVNIGDTFRYLSAQLVIGLS